MQTERVTENLDEFRGSIVSGELKILRSSDVDEDRSFLGSLRVLGRLGFLDSRSFEVAQCFQSLEDFKEFQGFQ